MKSRSIAWVKPAPFGVEFVQATLSSDTLSAIGVAIGTQPTLYRLDYELQTDAGFVTSRLFVTANGDGWRRTLDLRRSNSGRWSVATEAEGESRLPSPGGEVAPLTGASDCDLGLSPLTNTMPVLRHDLLGADRSVEFLMAWVSVPDLSVHAARQRYTSLRDLPDRGRLIRYESLDASFTAELTFDADGLVVDYPGLARSLPEPARTGIIAP
jgi:uncharacterized protein